MTIKQINDTLSLLACIACSEIEELDSSLKHSKEINNFLNNLHKDVRDHFIDVSIALCRCIKINSFKH